MGKVIVVDDEESLKQCLHDSITALGFEVESFFCPKQALDFFLNNRDVDISILFVDLNMPEIDGINFVKKLKEAGMNDIENKVIIMTGLVDQAVKAKLEEIEYKSLLLKPFKLAEISEILNFE